MKTEIYNLIILDESGSMGCVWNQTINGCNETINTIRAAQEKFAETQEHFVSIYAFQNGCAPSRYLIKNAPALTVDHISQRDYIPGGSTPLYDAVGATLVDLKSLVKDKEMAIGNVTIITDGEENSSVYYTREKVAQMISALKELGWSFNFIGANIDVKKTATSMNIDNALAFEQDEAGTRAMFEKERCSRMSWASRTSAALGSVCEDAVIDPEGRRTLRERLKKASENYFEDDSKK